MIWLKVAVAGRSEPLNFLLDSGAGASVFDLAAARSLDLHLGARQTVQGVHSRSAAFHIEDFAADDFAAQTLRLLQREEICLAGCEIILLTTRNGVLCARISVDGNAPEWMRLDTGCNTSLE